VILYEITHSTRRYDMQFINTKQVGRLYSLREVAREVLAEAREAHEPEELARLIGKLAAEVELSTSAALYERRDMTMAFHDKVVVPVEFDVHIDASMDEIEAFIGPVDVTQLLERYQPGVLGDIDGAAEASRDTAVPTGVNAYED
jgi:hypothetical protein